MIILKEIHTVLNLLDPEDIYDHDVQNLCKRLLSDKYVNKNYKSCYILEITKILNTSSKKTNMTLEGGCSIHVHFEARAMQYSPGDIIHGCEVISIQDKTKLLAKTQYAGVKIKCIDTGIYKVGDIIPAIIGNMAYNVGQNEMSFSASQFSPIFPENVYYRITEPLSPEDIKKCRFLLDKIAEIDSQKFREDEKKKYEFFQNLVYPYNKERKIPGFTPMDSIKSLQEGDIVFIPNEMKKSLKGFHKGAAKDTVPITAGNFYSIALIDYLKHKTDLLGFVEAYKFSDIKKYKLMWKTYNMLKK